MIDERPTENAASEGACESLCWAYLVSPAKEKRSVSGKPGRTVLPTPARVSFGGVIWESPIPRDAAEAEFFNGAVSRMPNA